METNSDVENADFMKFLGELSREFKQEPKDDDNDADNVDDDEDLTNLYSDEDEDEEEDFDIKEVTRPTTSKDINKESDIQLLKRSINRRKRRRIGHPRGEDLDDDLPVALDDEERAFLLRVTNSYDDDGQDFIDCENNFTNFIRAFNEKLNIERFTFDSRYNFMTRRNEFQKIEMSIEEEYYLEFKKIFILELDYEISKVVNNEVLFNNPKLNEFYSDKIKKIHLGLAKPISSKTVKSLRKTSIVRFQKEVANFIEKNTKLLQLLRGCINENLKYEEKFTEKSKQTWSRFVKEEEAKLEEEPEDSKAIEKRLCLPPYFKTPDGKISAPNDNSFKLPYCIRKNYWTERELYFLKLGVIHAISYKKTNNVDNMFLQKFQELEIQEKEHIANNIIQHGERKLVLDVTPTKSQGKVFATVLLNSLIRWKENEVKRIFNETKDTLDSNPNLYKDCHIPWDIVAAFMSKNKILDISEDECWRTFWYSSINFWTNTSIWTRTQLKNLRMKVRSIRVESGYVNWDEYALLYGEGRLPYQCFNAYRKLELEQTKQLPFHPKELDYLNELFQKYGIICCDKILNLLYEHRRLKGLEQEDILKQKKALKVKGQLNMGPLSSYQFLTNASDVKRLFYSKYNPVFRLGPIHHIEDALLLVIIEKMKFEIIDKVNLSHINKFLPWRAADFWKGRIFALFSQEWTNKWPLEMDKKLLELYQKYRDDYTEISKQMGYFASRKALRGRVLRLKKFLKKETLEEYHENRNEKPKKHSQRTHNLKRILMFIVKFLEEFINEPPLPFFGINPDEPPTDVELFHYLLSQPRNLVLKTAAHLKEYILARDDFWKPYTVKIKEEPTIEFNSNSIKIDRRKYDEKSPASVASALFNREIAIKSKLQLKDIQLSLFEREIIQHYRNFKSLNKRNLIKTTIPKAEYFYKLPLLHKIIVIPETLPKIDPAVSEKRNVEVIAETSSPKAKKLKYDSNAKGMGKKISRIKKLRKEIASKRWSKKEEDKLPSLVPVESIKKE